MVVSNAFDVSFFSIDRYYCWGKKRAPFFILFDNSFQFFTADIYNAFNHDCYSLFASFGVDAAYRLDSNRQGSIANIFYAN